MGRKRYTDEDVVQLDGVELPDPDLTGLDDQQTHASTKQNGQT